MQQKTSAEPTRHERPCQLCGGVVVLVPTITCYYRRCTQCGEKWAIKPPQPAISIKDLSDDRTDDALNELSKLQYDDERIHELGG